MRVAGFALKRHAIRCVNDIRAAGLRSVRCRTHTPAVVPDRNKDENF